MGADGINWTSIDGIRDAYLGDTSHPINEVLHAIDKLAEQLKDANARADDWRLRAKHGAGEADLEQALGIAQSENAQLKARVEELEATHYLPMDCPCCGRRRLEYSQKTNVVKCEKCGAENWEHPLPAPTP